MRQNLSDEFRLGASDDVMDNEFLTPEELAELTGRKLMSYQRAWLDRNGFIYVINAAGRPVVSRAYLRQRLSGGALSARTPMGAEPNFAALE